MKHNVKPLCLIGVAGGLFIGVVGPVRAQSLPVDTARSATPSINAERKANGALTQQKTRRLVTLADMLSLMATRYRINIVSDAYITGDTPRIMPDWQKATAAEAVDAVAKWANCELRVFDGVYTLRQRVWATFAIRPQILSPNAPARTAEVAEMEDGRGDLKIERADIPAAPDYDLPATKINVQAENITCDRLVKALRSRASFAARADGPTAARRVNIFATGIAPATLLGCVGFVTNSGPEVTLRQAEEQAGFESVVGNNWPPMIRDRLKPSAALRADLEKLLTPEQQKALENGEYIALKVRNLPLPLQKRTLEYLNLCANLYKDKVDSPDLSRSQDFQVRFLPKKAGSMSHLLGAVTIAADGGEFYY